MAFLLKPFKSLDLYHSGQIQQRTVFGDFFFIFPKIGFDISCKLSSEETICKKCQSPLLTDFSLQLPKLMRRLMSWKHLAEARLISSHTSFPVDIVSCRNKKQNIFWMPLCSTSLLNTYSAMDKLCRRQIDIY